MSIAEEWDDDGQPELDDFDGEADYDEHASVTIAIKVQSIQFNLI